MTPYGNSSPLFRLPRAIQAHSRTPSYFLPTLFLPWRTALPLAVTCILTPPVTALLESCRLELIQSSWERLPTGCSPLIRAMQALRPPSLFTSRFCRNRQTSQQLPCPPQQSGQLPAVPAAQETSLS